MFSSVRRNNEGVNNEVVDLNSISTQTDTLTNESNSEQDNINLIAKLLLDESAKIKNENGALQISKDGLCLDKHKAAHLELFIKLLRDNTSYDMVKNNVRTILCNNNDSEIVDAIDGILRHMAMTRSFRINTGKGEKLQTQYLMLALYEYMPNLMSYIIPVASAEVGSWNDIKILAQYCIDNKGYEHLLKEIATAHCKAITDNDYHLQFLASKWAPRVGNAKKPLKYHEVGKYYTKLLYGKHEKYEKPKNDNSNLLQKIVSSVSNSVINVMKPVPSVQYRKLLADNCREGDNFVVETAMCQKNWELVGSMLPKLTAKNHMKYKKAYNRHIEEEYGKYLMKVSENKAKMNTTGLQIHSIVQSLVLNGFATYGCRFNTNVKNNELKLLNLQWKQIEDNMVTKILTDEKAHSTFLNQISVIDRSGSMSDVSHVAVAIGLFIAKVIGRVDREKHGNSYIGFGDIIIRFSDEAEIISLTPTDNFSEYLSEYISKENKFRCGYTTNIMNVHKKIINVTKQSGLTIAPDLVILTDMQYNEVDSASSSGNRFNKSNQLTHHEKINKYYEYHNIVRGETRCWNLRGSTSTFEADGDCPGIVMIGGFNQGMLTLFVEGKNLAEECNKPRNEVTTWDTFKASQQHYDMATKWMIDGLNIIKDKDSLSSIEKQLVRSFSLDYVSIWKKQIEIE